MELVQLHDKNFQKQAEKLRSSGRKNLPLRKTLLLGTSRYKAPCFLLVFAREGCLDLISVEGSADLVSSGAQSFPPCILHASIYLREQTSAVTGHLTQHNQETEGCSIMGTVRNYVQNEAHEIPFSAWKQPHQPATPHNSKLHAAFSL